MLQALKSFIKEHQLFNNSDQLAVAVSGGADSTYAAYEIDKLNIPFTLVHCNFKLRGNESDLDELFVIKLASKLENCNSCLTRSFDTAEYSNKTGLNTQLAARKLRYTFFDELYKSKYYTKLITAHNKTDNTESFLMNLSRGSGLKGLSGIPIKRGYIVRPFISIDSKTIREELDKNNIEFRIDSSNLSENYLRNRVRHNILPILNEVFPEMDDQVLKSTGIIKKQQDLIENLIERSFSQLIVSQHDGKKITISKNDILSFQQPTDLLYFLLDKYDFNYETCEQIITYSSNVGSIYRSPNYSLVVDREHFILQASISALAQKKLELGENTWGNWVICIEKVDDFQKVDDRFTEYINITDLNSLAVRSWEQGDKIKPLGMKGSKLLSDIFIDNKVDQFSKYNTPIIVAENDVVWVAGYSLSDNYKIMNSKHIYRIKAILTV